MARYFLEMVEDGHRLPRGDPRGYKTREEAEQAALKHTDDALPRNYIRVMKVVSRASMGGDGEPYISKEV